MSATTWDAHPERLGTLSSPESRVAHVVVYWAEPNQSAGSLARSLTTHNASVHANPNFDPTLVSKQALHMDNFNPVIKLRRVLSDHEHVALPRKPFDVALLLTFIFSTCLRAIREPPLPIMIDHVLGRPSSKSRRLQVLAVLSFWSVYLYKGRKHGPPGVKALSKYFSLHYSAWQMVVITMMSLYAGRNFSALVGLASPEPMANMYDPAFFRATWVMTALDAGFWTAMRIQNKWLRDLASVVFSIFYLFTAERADEKVRKVRGMLTVEHLRVAWNKGTTPYLSFFQGLLRPRFTRWPPRQVRIPRPPGSDYKGSISAWLYYDGPLADLENTNQLVLDIPGGGFVAMDPRCNDDKLFAWAARSGLPILSLDYKKAPEYPYPFALNECFDVYVTLIKSKGRCIGMSGKEVPRVIITGDSAGGNLAVAATLMILETNTAGFKRGSSGVHLPAPDGLVCFYPALDMNIGNWMSDEQMSLIQDRRMRQTNKPIVRRKSRQYNDLVGTPHQSDDEDETPPAKPDAQPLVEANQAVNGAKNTHPEYAHVGRQSVGQPPHKETKQNGSASHRTETMKTRLATSSLISYFNDRVLTPEMMRAMIILYIGPHNRPDFMRDYLLSPVLAPDALLANFPKTYFMTGERDPLVDDTVIFAGRLRRAKTAARQASNATNSGQKASGEEGDEPEVMLIPGISHGFMQFPSIYPPAWKHFERCAGWFDQLFTLAEKTRVRHSRRVLPHLTTTGGHGPGRHHVRTESSGDEGMPLEIGMTKLARGRGMTRQQPVQEEEAAETTLEATAIQENGNEPDNDSDRGKKKTKKGLSKNKSLVKLSSSDDLLGRRMQGLTNGLTGAGDED
ncbi:hormone-sensitive lipase [Paramyrothecium foliicola]|nr:hormone-sensitive lipase [Paramyrothecium foliicola]